MLFNGYLLFQLMAIMQFSDVVLTFFFNVSPA